MSIQFKHIVESERDRDTAPDFINCHSGFTNKQLDEIVSFYRENGLQKSTALGDENNKQFRIAENAAINYCKENMWIYDRLFELVEEANKKFKFDLNSIVEEPQFVEYKEGSHIDWHADRNPVTAIRKLNLSIQLSESNSYEGGDLLINRGDQIIKMSRDRGSIALFPSFTLHKVSPVTAGVRNSLICWITGPSFK